MTNRQVPRDIVKVIIELANVQQLGCREIAKELNEKYYYYISYRTVARIIKEDREEKGEQFNAWRTEECIKSFPMDLEILDFMRDDLFSKYKSTQDILLKIKLSKAIVGIIVIKLSNFKQKEEEDSHISWEDFLKANPMDDYIY